MYQLGAVLTILIFLCACSQQERLEESEVSWNAVKEEVQEHAENEATAPLSITTGMMLQEEAPNGFSVMIENTPKARPQSGLAAADVVYEITVEGGITRFLALFHDSIPAVIGPVRSSRHYFLDIIDDWNVPYIHYGASPQAYSRLAQLTQTHIDGITNERYFSRDPSRTAPHNAYLHPDRLPLFSESVHNSSFVFNQKEYEETNKAYTLSLSYNSFTNVTYKYNPESLVYNRWLEGVPHTDRESGKQIEAATIVVQYAPHSGALDDSGRIDVDISKGGKASYFFFGQQVDGSWEVRDNHITYLDGEGEVIHLPSGKTWIQVVDAEKNILRISEE